MNLKKISDSDRDVKYAFLMVKYEMPELIQNIQRAIPEDDLYVDLNDEINGYGLETQSHVTLFPCLDNDTDYHELLPYLPKVSTLNIRLVNISLFENEEYDVLKCDVEVPSVLNEVNSELLKHFECHSEFKDYHPHMTIAYLKKDASKGRLCRDLPIPVELVPTEYDFSYWKDGTMLNKYFTNE